MSEIRQHMFQMDLTIKCFEIMQDGCRMYEVQHTVKGSHKMCLLIW